MIGVPVAVLLAVVLAFAPPIVWLGATGATGGLIFALVAFAFTPAPERRANRLATRAGSS